MKTQNIIIVKPQGYCGGVLKAIETAKKTRIQYPDQKIYFWHSIWAPQAGLLHVPAHRHYIL